VAGTDVLVVTVESTTGWRSSSSRLTAAIGRAGASAELVRTGPAREVRTFMLTDLVQAAAARSAAARAIARHQPRAIVYCSITAALLWPRPGAIWVDSLAAANRPGRHGLWQRPLERRRLRDATRVLVMSERSLDPLGAAASSLDPLLVRSPVDPSGPLLAPADRDITAIAYAADPEKRRLDVLLDAWRRARRAGEELIVTGITRPDRIEGVRWAGRLDAAEYRALLRRAKLFVTAARHEDYGIGALEALADGCQLVTTTATGPYPALGLARELDPRLVGDDLARAIRVGIDSPLPDYPARARQLVAPFGTAALDKVVGDALVPRLLTA
jgi:glycosyltransferase involved in cell wall biosynthesis